MATLIKTPEEIATLRAGGALLSQALAAVVAAVRPGVTTAELDAIATAVMRKGGGEPSFLGYRARGDEPPFPSTLCTSINHEVVHAPAVPARTLNAGDMIGLDIGVRFEGYCTDMAVTVPVGEVDKESRRLIAVTREALMRGIAEIAPGKQVVDIGRAVQAYVEENGFGVVRALVGHGIGKDLHEPPHIPNYVDRALKPVTLQAGMALCVEPMVTAGDWQVDTAADHWTVVTTDGSRSAHFELTVIVTEAGYDIITPLPV